MGVMLPTVVQSQIPRPSAKLRAGSVTAKDAVTRTGQTSRVEEKEKDRASSRISIENGGLLFHVHLAADWICE